MSDHKTNVKIGSAHFLVIFCDFTMNLHTVYVFVCNFSNNFYNITEIKTISHLIQFYSTPDSSRSVSFTEAITWPYIDEDINEE